MADRRIVGIIPAAGRAEGLLPLPIPKELFPIGYQDFEIDGVVHKRPKVISQYVVESMVAAGATRLVFVLGEGKHQIVEYYGGGTRFGVEIVYCYQERLTGMPGALAIARSLTDGQLVLFGMPDTIFEPAASYQELIRAHRERRCDLTLGLFPTQYPQKFGMVDFAEDGTIRRIVDKPAESDLAYMWGVAVWEDRFSDLLCAYVERHRGSERELLLGDVFSEAVASGLVVRAHPFREGAYRDIGTAEELDETLRRYHS